MKLWMTILPFLFWFSVSAQDSVPTWHVNPASLKEVKLAGVNTSKTFAERQDAETLVLVFLSPECPLSINYTRTLNELATSFGKKLSVIGIIPGSSYSKRQVRKFVRDYKLSFDFYIDSEIALPPLVSATITPEAVLLTSDGDIKYRGAIDDWAISLGKKRDKPQNRYLQNAITQYLEGSEIILRRTNAVGCLINDY